MLFSSPIFLFLFLPAVIIIYFLSPRQIKNLVLTVASLFFYTWGEGFYVLVLLGVVLVNYLLVIFSKKKNISKVILLLVLFFDLGFLCYFKYFVFFVEVISRPLSKFGIHHEFTSEIHMPLGISFVTFHLISYSIDVFRKEMKPEKNFLNFLFYILFFPHLIAGPIVRYKEIKRQIKRRKESFSGFASGVQRFIIGLSKKVLIANSLGQVADKIFAIFPQYLSSELVWLALICYSLQIYYDFSGYSDMAIGLAKMFGFTFPENFNYPYVATSIRDFWRRWHMTLSRWFRDYVYIPLGGSKRSRFRTTVSILVVFSLTGLWHGANWHFIFWGFYYGIFLVLERTFLGSLLSSLWRPMKHCYAILIILVGWLFFRIDSLSYAVYLLKVMFGINPNVVHVFTLNRFVNIEILLIIIVAVLFSTPIPKKIWGEVSSRFLKTEGNFVSNHFFPSFQMAALVILLLYSIMQISSNSYNPFIYFRF